MLSTSERTFKGKTEVLASNIFSHAAFTEMPGEAVCLSESQQGSQILYAALLTLSPPVASLEATDKKVLQHSWPL